MPCASTILGLGLPSRHLQVSPRGALQRGATQFCPPSQCAEWDGSDHLVGSNCRAPAPIQADVSGRECEEQLPSCVVVQILNDNIDYTLLPPQQGNVTCLDDSRTLDMDCSVSSGTSPSAVANPATTSVVSTVGNVVNHISGCSWNTSGGNCWNTTGSAPNQNAPQPTVVSSVAGRMQVPGAVFLTVTQTVTSLITTTIFSAF